MISILTKFKLTKHLLNIGCLIPEMNKQKTKQGSTLQ